VIVVLVSSWAYLTKYVAVVPHRTSHAKKLEAKRTQYPRARKRRFKLLRKFFGRVDRGVKVFSRRISAALLRIRGVSYLQERLFFTRAAVKSTVTVLLVFLVSVLTLYMLADPKLTYNLATGIYEANPSFHGFVLKTIEIGKAIVQALSPIGWLASAINNTLRAGAPGFRNALEGFGGHVTKPLSKLDLVWVYTLCQNVAAWASAVVALTYGKYASHLYRIRKPR